MAIKINNTTVVDNSRNIIGVGLTITGPLYASTDAGALGQVLKSTAVGVAWTTLPASGGSGSYDAGITSSVYVPVNSGIVTGTTATNNIFLAPGIGYTFPSTAGIRYVVESIHVSNKFSNELYLTSRHDYNGGTNTPFTQRVVIPYNGSVELLNQPIIANPSDVLRFQALDSNLPTANGINGGLDLFMTISAKENTTYVGVGTTVATLSSSGDQIIYVSNSSATMVQSIRLTNYNLNIDVDARVSIFRGEVRLGYLVYDLTVPKNSMIEILERPKYLLTGDSIRISSSSLGSVSVNVSARTV